MLITGNNSCYVIPAAITLCFSSDKIGYYYGFGYALPLLVVSVTALLQYKSYGDPDRGHCWLKTDEYMVWSFAGPVLVVIVINAIFLASALRIVQIHRYNSWLT